MRNMEKLDIHTPYSRAKQVAHDLGIEVKHHARRYIVSYDGFIISKQDYQSVINLINDRIPDTTIEYPRSEALVSRGGVIGIVTNVAEVEGAAGYLCYQGFLSPSMHGFICDGGYALADEVAPISHEQYKILAKEIFKLHKQAEIVENSMKAVFRAQKTRNPQYITYQSKMNNEPCTTR